MSHLGKANSWNPPLIQWIEQQITSHESKCRKLRRLHMAGDKRKAIHLEAKILRSFSARLCGELYEYGRRKASLSAAEPIEWDEFERRVNQSPLRGRSFEPALVHFTQKTNGTCRQIVSPGKRMRAAQRVLARVMDTQDGLNPHEHNCTGRGRNAAVNEIVRFILEEGIEAVVVFDLANFFPSVKPTHLEWLNIPNEVKSNVVFFTNHVPLISFANKQGPLNKTKPARHGLPQGAIASGRIASALLGRGLLHLGGEKGIVTYVDDGVIGARTLAEAQKIAHALQERMANLQGGPIGFKRLEAYDVKQGFEFLGYWIAIRETNSELKVRLSPSHSAKRKFRRNLFRRLRKLSPASDFECALAEMEEYLKLWLPQFSLWQPSVEEIESLKDEAASWVDDFFNGCLAKYPIPE